MIGITHVRNKSSDDWKPVSGMRGILGENIGMSNLINICDGNGWRSVRLTDGREFDVVNGWRTIPEKLEEKGLPEYFLKHREFVTKSLNDIGDRLDSIGRWRGSNSETLMAILRITNSQTNRLEKLFERLTKLEVTSQGGTAKDCFTPLGTTSKPEPLDMRGIQTKPITCFDVMHALMCSRPESMWPQWLKDEVAKMTDQPNEYHSPTDNEKWPEPEPGQVWRLFPTGVHYLISDIAGNWITYVRLSDHPEIGNWNQHFEKWCDAHNYIGKIEDLIRG